MGKVPVQIEHLERMRVAGLSVTSESPEEESLNRLLARARERNLLDGTYRLFGYDNCKPYPDHTYTAWLTVDDTVESFEGVTIQDIDGGLYATLEVEGVEKIASGWKQLGDWCRQSDYGFGTQQGLEEHLSLPGETAPGDMRLKLYLSIES